MKSVVGLLAAGLLATSLIPFNANAASLLGGLITTGSDSGNTNEVVSLGSGDGGSSIGLLGSDGIAVNLPLGGGDSAPVVGDLLGGGGGTVPVVGDLLGSGNDSGSLPVVGDLLGGNDSGSLPVVGDLLGGNGVNLPVDLGSVDIGVPGLAAVSSDPAPGGGSSVGIELLGGGGGTLGSNPLGLLGNGGVNVSLPGLGGVLPGGGDDGGGGGNGGGNGGNGGNGNSGGDGGNGGGSGDGTGGGNGGGSGHGGSGGDSGGSGTGGEVIIKYLSNNNGGGGSFAIPPGISSRLKALLRILAERDYLRVSNGRAVCLNSFGIAEVEGWVPQKDWGALQKALGRYSQDIYTLRQLLANCRNSGQRQALNLTQLNRVIALDIGKDGRPVLFML